MVILLVTAEEWLSLGLQSVGFGPIQQNRVDKTNLEQFLAHFGASPETHSAIFSDLQTTRSKQLGSPSQAFPIFS